MRIKFMDCTKGYAVFEDGSILRGKEGAPGVEYKDGNVIFLGVLEVPENRAHLWLKGWRTEDLKNAAVEA